MPSDRLMESLRSSFDGSTPPPEDGIREDESTSWPNGGGRSARASFGHIMDPPTGGASPRRSIARRQMEQSDADHVDFENVATSRGKTRHSKKIPHWMWVLIAKSLGIKLAAKEKPIVSSIIHLITLGSAAGMMFMNTWYEGYDIASANSPTDLIDGTVSVIMVGLYCGVGVYAHRLAYRLFVHPKFLEKMRLHSKTIMKLNAALIVFLVIAGFVLVQNLSLKNFAYFYQYDLPPSNATDRPDVSPCQTIDVPVEICQCFFFFQLIFSLCYLVWNVLLGVCLISVARTHTIDIRRFIYELDCDAHLQDKQFRQNFYAPESQASKDTLREYLWIDDDRLANVLRDGSSVERTMPEGASTSASGHETTEIVADAEEEMTNVHIVQANIDAIERDEDDQFTPGNVQLKLSEEQIEAGAAGGRGNGNGGGGGAKKKQLRGSQAGNGENKRRFGGGAFGRFRRLSEERDQDEDEEEHAVVPHIMTEHEIMHKYWKLASATRLTSMAFQRWMCCITVTVMFWTGIRLVYWLTHSPDFIDIFGFILPLLLLPLLSSAYAEVNYEGVKVLQSILPNPKRIQMFQYLYGMPIQMTAYSHRISYGTMGTVLAAVMAAFTSKILLQEMGKVIN